MNGDAFGFCRHALDEFAFLAEHGFTESYITRASSFSICYRTIQSHQIGVGAFLPRYEYDVTLTHNDNHCDLHELAAILDVDESKAPNWTWAHSDPSVFLQHITFSATLLRIVLTEFLRSDGDIWERVSQRRNETSIHFHQTEQLKTADAAFSAGRWGEAIGIYESISTLTPVQQKRLGIAKHRLR